MMHRILLLMMAGICKSFRFRPDRSMWSRLSASFSLLDTTPIVLRGAADIIANYDVWLLDQFGVLHDGVKAYPGAIEMVQRLHSMNKSTVIVSNSSQRSKYASKKLESLGFSQFSFVQTSGEIAHEFLSAQIGKRACILSWNDIHLQKQYFDDLSVVPTRDPKTADYIFFHGTQCILGETNSKGISTFDTGIIDTAVDEIIRIGIERNIPAICANNDIVAPTVSGFAYMPGLLAAEYIKRGGRVLSFGKPDAQFFVDAIQRSRPKDALSNVVLRGPDRLRCVHVGDSLQHDIAGAAAAGIDSVFISQSGIHRNSFNLEDKKYSSTEAALLFQTCSLCDAESTPRPSYILRTFSQ